MKLVQSDIKASGAMWAVIPARGGSKGLSGKNVRPLAGRPLIAYSIAAALDCPGIARCVVTSDSAEIRAVALAHGAEAVERPGALAGDCSPTQDAVRHVLETLAPTSESLPDTLVLLQPTSPLRTAAHVEACLAAFHAAGASSAIAVTEAEHHPYKAMRIAGGLLEPLFDAATLEGPRQSLPAAYRQTGAIYVVDTRRFLETNSFYVRPCLPFLMPAEASVDIDTPLDLALAELLLAGGIA